MKDINDLITSIKLIGANLFDGLPDPVTVSVDNISAPGDTVQEYSVIIHRREIRITYHFQLHVSYGGLDEVLGKVQQFLFSTQPVFKRCVPIYEGEPELNVKLGTLLTLQPSQCLTKAIKQML